MCMTRLAFFLDSSLHFVALLKYSSNGDEALAEHGDEWFDKLIDKNMEGPLMQVFAQDRPRSR